VWARVPKSAIYFGYVEAGTYSLAVCAGAGHVSPDEGISPFVEFFFLPYRAINLIYRAYNLDL
jgi:hypothetical protein